jgi:phytol kinase
MDSSLFALAIPPLLLIPAMGLLSRIRSSLDITEELKRKALHVATGLTALSFPLYFTSPWMVCAALGMVLAWMIAVRRLPLLRQRFGACLHTTKRVSFGEIHFALALAVLLLLTPSQPLLYVIPLLVLTLADSAAAIAGRLAPLGKLRGPAAGKTLVGCATFAVVAFLTTQLLLLSFTDLGFLNVSGIALAVAATSCIAEAVSHRGLDNIFIPAAAYSTLLVFNIT